MYKRWEKITIDLNNIASNINLDFDCNSIQTKIIKNYDFEEYNIYYTYYSETENPAVKKKSDVIMTKICSKVNLNEAIIF